MEPLEPGTLHPDGGSPLRAGEEVECSSDTDQRDAWKRRRGSSHPQLLLWSSKTNPYELRSPGANEIDQARFHVWPLRIRGRVDTDDVDAWKASLDPAPETLESRLGRADEQMPHGVCPPDVERACEEIRPPDTVRTGPTSPTKEPSNRRTVWQSQLGVCEDGPQLGVMKREREDMRVAQANVTARGTAAPLRQQPGRRVNVSHEAR
jgi:hypothetical protein